MGGSVSCLNFPEAFLKTGKKRSKIIKVEAQKPSKNSHVCQYCQCPNEECRIKKINSAFESAEKFRTVKCGTDNESIYIDNSQFPFRRPKTLAVKPYVAANENPTAQSGQIGTLGGEFAPKPIYGFYPYKNLQRLTVSEPTTYLHGQASQRTFENLKRSTSYNPGAARPVLPHRTVERLKSTESYQFFHDTYPPEIYTSHILETRSAKRPPTPWCQPSRTDDYMVASSLLAHEQDRERQAVGP